MSDDRQLVELHLRERWELHQWLERKLGKMERDVENGNALRRILNAERQAAIPGEHEQEHDDGLGRTG